MQLFSFHNTCKHFVVPVSCSVIKSISLFSHFPLWGGGAGSPSNTKSPGPRPNSIPSGIFIQPFGHNRYGPKIGGSVFHWGRVAGSPSNTIWPGLRPSCMPSSILIHPTTWPQYTNVTDRETGQDRTGRQWSDSIGRTVLQTVTQKLFS